jgi:IclR family KDG regulon transcriptional repressor
MRGLDKRLLRLYTYENEMRFHNMKNSDEEVAESRGQIKSVDKAIDILQVLAAEKAGMQLNEITRKLRINISTAHHLLDTLKRRGLVDQDKRSEAYFLGYNFIDLALKFLSQTDLYSASLEPIHTLRDNAGETSYLNVVKHGRIISLIELAGNRPVQAKRSSMPESPDLYATSSGKLFLAYLPMEQSRALLSSMTLVRFTPHTIVDPDLLQAELETIRQQGFAFDQEEHLLGVACIDAPVFNYQGKCLASASLSYPAPGMSGRTEELLPLVVHAAAQISRQLGYFSHSA